MTIDLHADLPADPHADLPADTCPDERRGDALGGRVCAAVLRHRAGDDTAMTDLVRLLTPWVWHICRSYRMPLHTAQDAVQNTLLTLFSHLHTVRDPHSTLAWVSTVARREAVRVVTKERRTDPVGDTAVFDRPVDGEDPQSIVERRMGRELVLRNLRRLPERRRRLLCAIFLAETAGYTEIAEMLDMPVGSIGPTRQRSLAQMRRLLDADGEEWFAA